MMTSEHSQWTAIVLAGQRPGVDPLAAIFGGTYKALIEIAGRPMVSRVVDVLLELPNINRIVVLAQEPALLLRALPNDSRITVSASNSGISASIRQVAGTETAPWPVFVTTADHPLLKAETIRGFLDAARGHDLSIGMVERQVMFAAYPHNRRTWLKFRDGAWSGANMFALNTAHTSAALDLWAEAEQDRKKAWKLFLHFGPWLAFRALTRTISLRGALLQAGRRLNLSAQLVALNDAEAAIDVDKASDHQLAEKILKARHL